MRGGGVPIPAGEGSQSGQKILNFSISKWRICILVYSVAITLTFWLQRKAVKT